MYYLLSLSQCHLTFLQAGIVRLQWDSEAPLIYTCTLDGVVNTWDSRTGKVEGKWTGHEGSILDMAIAR